MGLSSVWEAGREPTTDATPVAGHREVVVVGGGLTGVALALLLASAGRSVLVVEARHLGAGTTGRSTAKVSTLQGTRLGQISRRHGKQVLENYVAGNSEGLAWLRRFCEEHGVAAQVRTAWTYATTEEGARRVQREHDLARGAGLDAALLPEAPLPFPTTAAVSLADQMQLDPLELLDALAGEATARGAEIAEGTRVRQVRGSGPVEVVTEHGVVTADRVVIATNVPVLDRGAHFARLRPSRSYGLSFSGADGLDLDGMFLSADGPTRSLRDADLGDGRLLLVGGEGHPTGRGGSTRARLDTLRSWTAEHFPGLTETHAWSAQDYLPAHELPFVGPLLPDSDHLLLAGGYAKWGLTNGIAAALALSARLLGGRIDWADAMAGWTRHELAGLPSVAAINAEVGFAMVAGWLTPLGGAGRSPGEGEGLVQLDGVRAPTACSRVGGVERKVSAVCPHLGGIVRWNDAEASWDCPLHGSRFDADGTLLEGPATTGLRAR